MTNRRERRMFTQEFKKQIVELHKTGKRKSELMREYELSSSTLARWIKQSEKTGSFKHADNLTEKEKELLRLRKENQKLKMENDILKQAALIMGRKD